MDQHISSQSQRILTEIRAELGLGQVTPELFQYLAKDDVYLERVWQCCKDSLLRGNLPRLLKEMIFVVVAHERNCSYCTNAHMAFCKLLGADSAEIMRLTQDLENMQPELVRKTLGFVRELTQTTAEPHTDRQMLVDAGLTQEDIDEVVRMTGFACQMTVLAKGAGLNSCPDQAFLDILTNEHPAGPH